MHLASVFDYYPLQIEEFRKQVWSTEQINEMNADGWTLLMVASLDNRPDWVKELVAREADMDLKNPSGQKAIIIAANAGHDKVMIHLLLTGAGG